MKQINSLVTEKLIQFANGLIDQEKARVIVPANDQEKGYWFGGGNMISDEFGNLWLIGRYRDHGDSRTGVGAGLVDSNYRCLSLRIMLVLFVK